MNSKTSHWKSKHYPPRVDKPQLDKDGEPSLYRKRGTRPKSKILGITLDDVTTAYELDQNISEVWD